MNGKRLNSTLPEKVAEALAEYDNKSRFIAEALMEKMQRDKKEKISALMIQGYKNESRNDKKLNQEWEDATLKGWPK